MEENKNELIEIQNENKSIVENAKSLQVESKEDYINATDFAKEISTAKKKVIEYWKEPKKQADEAHKAITRKEKEMLQPLNQCETILKAKISDYVQEQERLAREEEARLKAEQEKLAMQQLEEADKLRKQGNEVEAAVAEENAVSISQIDTKVDNNVKVEGISFRKDYEIIIADPNKVPAYFNGIELREIKTNNIKKLVKMTNNTIKIPRSFS